MRTMAQRIRGGDDETGERKTEDRILAGAAQDPYDPGGLKSKQHNNNKVQYG
jgi:hypothetical protein